MSGGWYDRAYDRAYAAVRATIGSGGVPGPGRVSGWAGRRLAILVAGAFFMEILDGTIIATAAPRMAESLGVRAVDVNVVMTAYLLTLAAFIPVSGWLADRFGARTVFATAIVVFTLASAGCAASTSLPVLTGVRVLQGIGGAMMVPVGRLVVLRATAKQDLIPAIAYLTWPALVAPVIAPGLGGLFATYASWRWIFLVNLPLGAVALLAATRLVPNTREPTHPVLDGWGFLLSGAGLAALVLGLERIGAEPVDWGLVAALLAVAAVLVGLAVRHLQRARHPLLSLGTLTIPTFRAANRGGSLFRIAISAVPFLVPLMVQEAFGWSPVRAGLVTMAIFVGNIAVKPATTPLLRRFGFRPVLLVNGWLTVLAVACCGLLGAGTPTLVVLAVLVAGGIGRSVNFTAYNTITFADVPAAQTSSANTLSSTIFQLSVGMGVAVGALAVRVGGPIADALGLDGAVGAYRVAFVLLAMLLAIAVIEARGLARDAGAAVSGVAG